MVISPFLGHQSQICSKKLHHSNVGENSFFVSVARMMMMMMMTIVVVMVVMVMLVVVVMGRC
jgi:hypothetical protein